MNSIFIQPKDSVLSSIAKGLATGGLTTLGVLGIANIYDFLKKRMFPKAEVSDENYIMKFTAPTYTEKAASIMEKEGTTMSNYFMYGLGLPIGAYLANRVVGYLRDKEEQYKILAKSRELYESYKGNEVPEQVYIKKIIQKPEDFLKSEKVAAFLDSCLDDTGIEKQGQVADLLKTFTVDAFSKWLPMAYGAILPIGFLVGYHGTKYLNPYNPAIKDYEVMDTPALSFRFDKKPDKILGPVEKRGHKNEKGENMGPLDNIWEHQKDSINTIANWWDPKESTPKSSFTDAAWASGDAVTDIGTLGLKPTITDFVGNMADEKIQGGFKKQLKTFMTSPVGLSALALSAVPSFLGSYFGSKSNTNTNANNQSEIPGYADSVASWYKRT